MHCQFAPNNRSPGYVSPDPAWTVPPDDQPVERQGRSTVPGEHRDNRNRSNGRFLTATMMRQISLGGVLGLAAGLGLRVFSQALALVLGVGLVVVEWATSKGYNLLPVGRLQRYMKGVSLEQAMTENILFKTSFGATMILAAFVQFEIP